MENIGWKIYKDKYIKFKEIILYLFGLSFFYSFNISKIFLGIMIACVLIDIFYFKEKLECGNEKLRNFIILLVFAGAFWNFLACFDYRVIRSYLKINRYFIIIFYLYSLVKYKKSILRNFIVTLAISYLTLFIKGIVFYNETRDTPYLRFGSFEGIMEVALLSAVVGSFSFGRLIKEKDIKYKMLNFSIFLISLFLIIITQTRMALLALIVSIGCMIIFNKNIKVILLTILLGGILLFGFLQTPQAKRFKENTFNTQVSQGNMSNGLRIEMWKNAIWRYKQHPILGTGTKQDHGLFLEYAKNMPETTETEKIYKKALINEFDDAHSMYLNGLTNNGLFFFFHLAFIFGILPYIIIKNKSYKYRLSLVGTLAVYSIFGFVWSIWRHGWDPMLLWLMVALICCSYIFEEEK